MKKLALASLLLLACGAPAAGIDAATIDAATVPRTARITNDVFNDPGPGIRLSDGATVATGGDLWIQQRSNVSLYVGAPLGICGVGHFTSLDAVPTTLEACLDSAPSESAVLGSNQNATNQWSGRSWIVFADIDGRAPLYRVRAVSDTDVNPSITLTIEYAQIP